MGPAFGTYPNKMGDWIERAIIVDIENFLVVDQVGPVVIGASITVHGLCWEPEVGPTSIGTAIR